MKRRIVTLGITTVLLAGCTPTEQALWAFRQQTDATPEELVKAACIIDHESKGDPEATSPQDDRGMFQLHWSTWGRFFGPEADAYDPVQNGVMAGTIFLRSNRTFTQWTTNRKC